MKLLHKLILPVFALATLTLATPAQAGWFPFFRGRVVVAAPAYYSYRAPVYYGYRRPVYYTSGYYAPGYYNTGYYAPGYYGYYGPSYYGPYYGGGATFAFGGRGGYYHGGYRGYGGYRGGGATGTGNLSRISRKVGAWNDAGQRGN